ncbi:MAG TPA: ABC transporter permease [Bryobacteraceae bacterium]|nr:ABC transporter permease [Bryobacteraceae bacterium]
MLSLLQDARYAVRVLFQNRIVTIIAVLAIALGIGANTAIFGVVNAILLKPLPYYRSERLVSLLLKGTGPVAGGDFLDIRKQARSYDFVGAAEAWGASLTGREVPERISGIHMSEDMFRLLGVPAMRGRALQSDDYLPGHRNVVVIGYDLWQRTFGGASDVVGQKILLDSEPYTIVGVMPPQFHFAPFWITNSEMWAPLDLSNRTTDRVAQSLRIFGRLRDDVSLAEAQAEIDGICSNLARAYPQTDTGLTIRADDLREKAVGRIRPALLVILFAVGFVLLIACANVANLTLARATARSREIAIRVSLGARRARIVRQLLTESVMLALVGGALGLVLAVWGTHTLQLMLAPDAGAHSLRLPRANEIGIDMPVLLFTFLLSLATGIGFGLAPAVIASRSEVNETLKEGGRSFAGGARGAATRRSLIVAEIAVAIVLLIGAGLLMRSFLRLQSIDGGFNPRNVVTMVISVAGHPNYLGVSREVLYNSVISSVEALPGVRSASMVNHLPLAGDVWGMPVAIEGRPLPRPGQDKSAVYRVARPNYFATMRIPIAAGRDFTAQDGQESPGVAIINETFARHEWPGETPLGKRVAVGDLRGKLKWLAVVGVIKDVKQSSWAEPVQDEVYLPYAQTPLVTQKSPWFSYMTLVVRTDGDPVSLARPIEQAIWRIDRTLSVSEVQTMEHTIYNATWQPRFNVLLVGIFACVALVLAMVGIYGVLAYEVAQRTHELGLRLALGAGRGGIVGLVLRESLQVVALGAVIGLASAFGMVRLLSSLLYEVKAVDPLTFAGVPALVIVVAAIATLLPAYRATRVDPIVALRYE